MDTDYLNGLSHYAGLMKIDLRIAIFWSKWCLWTLVYPDDFKCEGSKSVISIMTAMKRNMMSDFGDVMIGTTLPLTIRIYSDKQQPHIITDNNISEFTIGKIEMLCNSTPITIECEQRIAFALMLFGDLDESSIVINSSHSENEIEYIEFSYFVQHYDVRQGFCIINSLSTIISRQYGQLTAPQGKVQRLSPNIAPGLLGFVIPEDYQGKALPLWRFHLTPKYE